MAVLHITQPEFQQEVLDYKGLVLVDFFAPWCGPCKMTAPILDELAEEKKEVKFVKIDVDQYGDLAGQYNVSSIPTFVLFKDGKVVSQFMGAMGKEEFLAELNKTA